MDVHTAYTHLKNKKILAKVLHEILLWKLNNTGGLKGTITKLDGRLSKRERCLCVNILKTKYK